MVLCKPFFYAFFVKDMKTVTAVTYDLRVVFFTTTRKTTATEALEILQSLHKASPQTTQILLTKVNQANGTRRRFLLLARFSVTIRSTDKCLLDGT